MDKFYSTAKLLIVDDEEINIQIIENVLQDAGIVNLKAITDPRKAVGIFEEWQPDLLLVDMMMERMNGIELIELLQPLIAKGAFFPILMLTADASQETKRRALASGATDFLNKPFDHIEVLLRIRNLLRTRHLHLQIQNQNDVLEEMVGKRTYELEKTLTELRDTQQQVIEQERLRAMGQMSSGIAHDFNNALVPIVGYSELLVEPTLAPQFKDEVQEYLEIIHTAAIDAANVVSRLREFYRTHDDDSSLLFASLNDLVKQAISFARPRWKDQAEAGGCTIQVKTELAKIPMLLCNAPEIREVATNLIFNAVDAMPKGGTITIKTYRTGDALGLDINDTGTGMTPEVRERCLQPFFTTKGNHGTGLGLAMVSGILHRHDATLAIESEPGKGTTFRITIPLPSESARDQRPDAARVWRPLSVVLVDDAKPNLDLVSKYLLADGHQVYTYESGAAALKVLEEFDLNAIDLFILDRAMPDMNGDQLAIHLQEMAPGKPVILLTGFGDIMKARGERPENVSIVVSKPVTVDQLRTAIAKVMPTAEPLAIAGTA